MEDSFKKVRIVVATDPAKGEHLEVASHNVPVERAELVRPQINRDADLVQLLLDDGSHLARGFFSGGLESQSETGLRAAAVRIPEPRLVQQSHSCSRIIAVSGHGFLIGPVVWRQQA